MLRITKRRGALGEEEKEEEEKGIALLAEHSTVSAPPVPSGVSEIAKFEVFDFLMRKYGG